jgi:glycine cleavage system H lipoate-binding protein/ABC-type phosphate transport system substrate-binding protein
MKIRICLFIAVILLNCCNVISKELIESASPAKNGSINVFTSPGLLDLTMKWVNEYNVIHPMVKINVIKSTNENIAGLLKNGDGIGFTDVDSWAALNQQAFWNMVVGRDVIVPVMNDKNPFRDEICRKGITPESLSRILTNPELKNWETLTGNTTNLPGSKLHYYTTNDSSIQKGVENFLNTSRFITNEIKTGSPEELISAIQQDTNGFGFCKLTQVTNPANQSLAEHLVLVPIDKNGNGKIDYMENIYENLQAFARGVWIGKYPKTLSGSIYMVSSDKPQSTIELAFLNWVLTDGQQFLNAKGYSDLVLNDRQSQLARINEPVVYATIPMNETNVVLRMILIVLAFFVVSGFILEAVIRRIRNKNKLALIADSGVFSLVDEDSIAVPNGLYFDKTHTWSFMKKDGTVKIGIDDFIQHITGPITRIEMKTSGEKIKKGDRLLTIIQKGKQLNIYAPVSGTIKTQNKALIHNASLLNSAPYDDGWVYTIEPTNWLLETQFLSMAEKYKAGLKNEFLRLKDFFATVIESNTKEYAFVTLQDGGALRDCILADFGPEVWDDFQTKFIDISR